MSQCEVRGSDSCASGEGVAQFEGSGASDPAHTRAKRGHVERPPQPPKPTPPAPPEPPPPRPPR